MAQLITKMKRARINKYEPAAARRASIDEELEELLKDPELPPVPADHPFLLSTEDILEMAKNRK